LFNLEVLKTLPSTNYTLRDQGIIINTDCLGENGMPLIEDNSIDLILTDLPYQETANRLDIMIPFEPMWEQYNRILKPNGCILLFAQGKFFIKLVMSNFKAFKYELIWDKSLISGHLNASRQPLRQHEQVCVFRNQTGTYNPQMTQGKPLHSKGKTYMNKEIVNQNYGKFNHTDDSRKGSTEKFPTTILRYPKVHPSKARHRTEKSVPLLEWLIKTYSNPGDVVLDSCVGSGSTCEAAIGTNRFYIGMEMDTIEYDKMNQNIQLYTNARMAQS
jgi:site-specific DNA-methyltransferase (adenine-specific)